jgi:excisionase family DNA binding protein
MDSVLEPPARLTDLPVGEAGERTYFSISEAATLLGVSRVTIWRWIRAGRLAVRRLGHRTVRISRQDLERLVEARSRTGTERGASGPLDAPSTIRAGALQKGGLPIAWGDLDSGEHAVQFYEADEALLDAVGELIGPALRAGDAGVVIATEAHRAGIEERLRSAGLDLATARSGGRYVELDAAETLARIMAGETPDSTRLRELVGGILERAAEGGRRVRVFGEMVALLVEQGSHAAALQLEALWNDLQRTHAFALLCGYPADALGGEAFADLIGQVCAEHTRVVAPESEHAGLLERERTARRQAEEEVVLHVRLNAALRAAAEERDRALAAEREARTGVERARQLADFLSAASAALSASLDYEQMLGGLAKLVVPSVADWCVVDLAEPADGGTRRLRRIAAAHADPAKELLIYRLQEEYPTLEVGAAHTAVRVLRTGRPWFDPDVSEARLEAEARDEGHLALTRALGFAAEMVVPLIARGQTLGTITLVGGPGRSFDEADLAVAEELASRCALAIANAQAFAEADAARTEAQRAAEGKQRLQEITGQLGGSLEPEQVLANIARSGAELLQAPVGAVFLLDPGEPGGDFRLAAAHGIDEARALGLRLPRRASLAGRAVDVRRTLVVNDVREDPGTALPALLTGETAGAEIAAPIMDGATGLGVVKVFSPSVRVFGDDDAALLSTLAAAAAVALTNARLYREAQDAVRARDEFLSAAAHDLKTPLTSVKGMAQLLRRQVARSGVPTDDRLMEGLARIDATATKMGQQLDELVDLTRLQMGQQLELRRGSTDLVVLAQRVAAEQQQLTNRHRIRVETSLPELVGEWDAVRLGRVLDNLVSNAIKYSPAGGDVVVSVAGDDVAGDGWATLAVADEGLGIPAADLPLIFERFRRARNVDGRIGGTGIGLASARQIVAQHHGELVVESVEGRGSTFTMRLPLATGAGHVGDAGAEFGQPRDITSGPFDGGSGPETSTYRSNQPLPGADPCQTGMAPC